MSGNIENEEQITYLYEFGWAPGWYTFKCINCPQKDDKFGELADKRSWRCQKHAHAAFLAEQSRDQMKREIVSAILSAYHTTRLREVDPVDHILKNYRVDAILKEILK